MIRKTSLMVMLILVIMTSSVFAMIPETMDIQTAERRSMETLLINSINGTRYELFLISDNARYQQQYLFEKNGIYVGDFYVYLARLGDDTAFLQKKIGPFHTLDCDGLTRNGCYVITSNAGMPDVLENVSRVTGGGGYDTRFFAIKDGRLRAIIFMNQNRKIQKSPFWIDLYRETEPVRYLDDGTFYIHWWTNAWPEVGSYKAVYMFDYQNLIMIEAYTYKMGPRDDDYHRI